MTEPNKVEQSGDFPDIKETSGTVPFADQVSTVISEVTRDGEGKLVFPEGISEEAKYAATSEIRRRDTESALSKEKTGRKATETERDTYLDRLTDKVTLDLSSEQIEELNDLKQTDPDAWKAKLDEHEVEARNKLHDELDEISTDTIAANEEDRREGILETFLAANPALVLDDDAFENDLPPRITGKLERGEVSFEDFLVEAKEFLTKGAKIAGTEKIEKEPDLNKTGGGSTADPDAVKADIVTSYKDEIY